MDVRIGTSRVGEDCPVFVIAELSANHAGKFETAAKTLAAMKAAGADAVKVQTYTPDTITLDSAKKYFKIKGGTPWDGNTFYELYKEAYMPWEWQPRLQKIARDLGLVFFSSPFDFTAVDYLEEMDVPAYKIASLEITDIPLIEYTAAKHKPMILSTGVAEEADIKEAVRACKKMGNENIILLKCTTAYPTPLEEVNLRTIPDLTRRFKAIAGLSDHTLGTTIPVAAVALGARVVEKHFILNRSQGGPDALFSLEPAEFKSMVQAIRDVERSLGDVNYNLSKQTRKAREMSRSLFAVCDIRAGESFSHENVKSIRPAAGLAPKHLPSILRRKASVDIQKGTPLTWEMTK